MNWGAKSFPVYSYKIMEDISALIAISMKLPQFFASLKSIHNWHVKVQENNIESTIFLGSSFLLTFDLFLYSHQTKKHIKQTKQYPFSAVMISKNAFCPSILKSAMTFYTIES